jgi:HlyD family secretion protein
MHKAVLAIAVCSAGCLFAQEVTVSRASIWSDTVKRGAMTIQVRGLGQATGSGVNLRIAETQVKDVRAGQTVSVDARSGKLFVGKVARIDPVAANGTVSVEVRFDGEAPPAGVNVDGTIEISKLSDVVYVGRPVFGQAGSESTLFRVDPDGAHATRVRVRFGVSSVNTIEVRDGVQPGDHLILSDMSAYERVDRIRLQ